MSHLRHVSAAAVLVLATTFGLGACSSDGPSGSSAANTDGDDEVSPEEALAFAKSKLDETSGIRLTLSTDDQPDSDAFLSEASGVITADPPAFEGKASGTFEGLPASDVDIVSVGGKVYAKIFGGFQDFTLPACVPDPAGLLDPETGFGTVLTDAQEVSDGEQARGGADNDEIVTTYAATVPGESVTNLLPCAPGDEFTASFTLDDQGALTGADLQGEFFPGGGELTYSFAIEAYDVAETITKP